MRILHTADWHLGKKTDDLDRLEEQKQVLEQVIKIAKEKAVDMVLIAGDIYDTFVPSADAESLFYRTASELSNNGNTAVIAIAGNHDEPKRMSNASLFSSKFNIYLVGYPDDIKIAKNANNAKNIYPTASGNGYIKFKTKAGEEAVVACLPYPTCARFNDTLKEGETYEQKIREWLAPAVKEFKPNTINILMSHLLTYGSNLSYEGLEEYMRISSNLSFVDKSVLNVGADYVALGHIHKLTKLDKDHYMYYSGSILNNHFQDESGDRYVLIVDVDCNGVKNVEPIELETKKLVVFTSDSLDEIEKFCDVCKNDYVKATLKQAGCVSFEKLKELRQKHPNLITLSVLNEELMHEGEIESKKDLTTGEVFDKFVLSTTGKAAKPEVKELFLELMGEDVYETN